MPLITVVVVLVVAGPALWTINSCIPMARQARTILNVVVEVVLCVWLLQAFGVIGSIRNIRLGQVARHPTRRDKQ